MEGDKTLFSTHLVSLDETVYGFQFLERRGKDSVAIFLVRRNGLIVNQFEVLVRYQPLCVDSSEVDGIPKLFPCPLTGSLGEGEEPQAAAVRETFEEASFAVEMLPLGQYIVGTQTNEICYMFYADVTGVDPQIAPQDGSFFEAASHNR